MTVALEKNPSIKWTVSVCSSVFELKHSKAREFLTGNIMHGVVRYERMKSWAKFTQNAILLYCLFLFMESLTFPSSISFPIDMERSKRTTTRIGHLYSSTKNKQKGKKIQPYDRRFAIQQYIKSL